jgi:hypothetical protein
VNKTRNPKKLRRLVRGLLTKENREKIEANDVKIRVKRNSDKALTVRVGGRRFEIGA